MRVIAGQQKGRRLTFPKHRPIRPTSERVREALFAIVQDHLPGANILDLYAGTGAIGIEALSRGAKHVVFVEADRSSRQAIEENLELCSLTHKATVLPYEASRFLKQNGSTGIPDCFHLVFADPPYYLTDYDDLLGLLSRSGKVSLEGRVIVEHFSKAILPHQVDRLVQSRQSRYGDTTLTFFEVF